MYLIVQSICGNIKGDWYNLLDEDLVVPLKANSHHLKYTLDNASVCSIMT